ncbi:MAG: DedA family protein [Alistipes sp.]|jgi:membrane protein YqaA with SNARE-associated domain|nr:DedA family protein [Alistipes sp.]
MEFLAQYGLLGLFIGSFLASTVIPMSADVLLVGMLIAGLHSPVAIIVVATLGNWIGGITSYGIGRAGKWEWIERLGVNRESLEKQQHRIERYGAPIALLTWVPIIGDVFAVALGFYRVKFIPATIWMGIGKAARFVCWYLIYTLF